MKKKNASIRITDADRDGCPPPLSSESLLRGCDPKKDKKVTSQISLGLDFIVSPVRTWMSAVVFLVEKMSKRSYAAVVSGSDGKLINLLHRV